MYKIYKFLLPQHGPITYEVPRFVRVLTAQMQGDGLVLWALVDLEAGEEEQTFHVVYTGEEIPDAPFDYHGTVQRGGFVLHVLRLKTQSEIAAAMLGLL